MINQLMQNVLVTSLVSSALAIFFIASRKIIVKCIGATWNYYLWFTLFIPWIAIWFPCNFLSRNEAINLSKIIKPINISFNNMSTQFHLSIAQIFFILWLMGIFTCLLYIFLNHFKFSSRLKQTSIPIKKEEHEKIKLILSRKCHEHISRIRLSSMISSPMLCHLIKPTVYLSDNFFQYYSVTEQKYVLEHEYIHLQRYDLLANIFMLVFSCINWFNPLLYSSYRNFRAAQELACDAVICKGFTPNEKKVYGYTLLKTVTKETFQILAMSYGWNTGTQLKERCQMLKLNESRPMKTIFGIFAIVTFSCVAIAAPNLEKYNQSESEINLTADNIQSVSNGQVSLLKGNVQLHVGHNKKITGDNVSVKYSNDKPRKIIECIIKGKGFIQDGEHVYEVKNGVFNFKTLQISAEAIKTIK